MKIQWTNLFQTCQSLRVCGRPFARLTARPQGLQQSLPRGSRSPLRTTSSSPQGERKRQSLLLLLIQMEPDQPGLTAEVELHKNPPSAHRHFPAGEDADWFHKKQLLSKYCRCTRRLRCRRLEGSSPQGLETLLPSSG